MLTATRPTPGAAARRGPDRRALLGVGVPLALGLLHVAFVAPRYFVGSFDDDASYILVARSLAAGHGLTAHLPSGAVVAGLYPPGYPALLAPLVRLAPHAFWDLRLLSTVAFAALFPLTWAFLGRRAVDDRVRVTTLLLLALSPVAATFATMVMAEMPFLVVFVAMLLALDRWEADARTLCWPALGVVAGAVALVWLKEAAVGMVAGLVLWLLLTKAWRKGVLVAAVSAASLLPVVAARLLAGIPLAGSRYSQELGAYYQGSLTSRLVHVVPAAAHQLLSVALPATVVPRGLPLPVTGDWAHVLALLAWQVTVLTALGAAVWVRRHRDGATVIAVVYLAEALLWPYINERRVILVLPLVLAWYALGIWSVVDGALARARARRWPARPAQASLAALTAAVIVVPLAAQFERDYLFADFQDTSRPGGSRYMAVLATVPPRNAVIETDYTSTTALFTGRRTAETAFLDDDPLASISRCVPPATTLRDLTADGAGWVLTGALNKADVIDDPCLLDQATSEPWAVRLLRTARDGASVFELIGPGTVHPQLRDLLAGATPATSGPAGAWPLAAQGQGDNPGSAPVTTGDGRGTFTWTWPSADVTQVSLGGARSLDGPTSEVTVALRLPGGAWRTVAVAHSGVGDAPSGTPFLVARPPAGTAATGLRVTVDGPGRVTAVDVHVLGLAG